MRKSLFAAVYTVVAATLMLAVGCQNPSSNPLPPALGSILVVSEGNWNGQNSSITAYDPIGKTTVQNLFGAANGNAALGDSPTHAIRYNSLMYLTLSGSGKIYMIDPATGVLKNKMVGLNSPRYISFINDTKGYITELYRNKITVFDPSTSTVTGSIAIGSPAEQMVRDGDYIYACQWSFGHQIIKIDTRTDKAVDSVDVGIQPSCLWRDNGGSLWTLADGGYEGNPLGYEAPQIVKIATGDKLKVEAKFPLSKGAPFSYRMTISPSGDRLFYTAGNKVFTMGVNDKALPSSALAEVEGASFYAIAVNPYNREIYVADAVDYVQPGVVYRFAEDGVRLDKFTAFISPSIFLF